MMSLNINISISIVNGCNSTQISYVMHIILYIHHGNIADDPCLNRHEDYARKIAALLILLACMLTNV